MDGELKNIPTFKDFTPIDFSHCKYQSDYTDKYAIDISSTVGSGINGDVYLGRNIETDLKVVIKFLKPSKTNITSLELHKSMVKHQNIMDILDYYLNYCFHPTCNKSKEYWLVAVCEFIDGCDLHDYFFKNGNLITESTVKEIVVQIVKTIKYLSEINLVHGDIKHENIIYNSANGKITIIDTDTLSDTSSYKLRGTHEYFSWEMVRNGFNTARKDGHLNEINGLNDLWAVGVLIYCALEAKYPFKVNTFYKSKKPCFRNIITFNYTLPSKFSSELNDLLHRIFQKPILRISIDQFLDHPWLNPGKLLSDIMPPTIPSKRMSVKTSSI